MAMGFAQVGIEGLRRNWGWVLALGIALIVLGMVALGAAVWTTVVSVMFFGWLLLVGGAMQTVHGFWRREWSGFFLDLLTGILYLVVGMMFITEPVESAVAVTLMLAAALLFVGVMRIIVALSTDFQHRIWLLLNGAVTLALGLMIWFQWPASGLWVLGLFIGIDMLFYGWALVMLAIGVRSMPAVAA
jgi:uncharacterized membrane protein HdeD (DUF308 family)